jgi:arsenite methyltransferase
MSSEDTRREEVRKNVREGYAKVAKSAPASSCCCGCSPSDQVAKSVGYSDNDLAALPEGSNMGLSCGNPTAVASLRSGEVVLDLGSGGGLDVFIAAGKVGPHGKVIGVDMTPEMLDKARRNAADFNRRTGLNNVEFRLGEIEHLPVADNSVDVVISNCVINLSPEKQLVWNEVTRVLKPGGRIAVSDLALLQPLPEAIRESVAALVGCVAGAVLVEETGAMLEKAGLVEIGLQAKNDYIAAMTGWEDPLYREIIEHLPKGTSPADFVTSLYITARKPA